jgi:hypothetical protein
MKNRSFFRCALLLLALQLAGGCAPAPSAPAQTPVVEVAPPVTSVAAAEPESEDEPDEPKEPQRPPPAAVAPSAPPPAPAADAQQVQARQLFRDGVGHYQQGDYAKARDAFLAAYNLSPHPKVLFNVATAAYQAKDPGACRWLERWKQEANPTPTDLASIDPGFARACP